MTLFLGKSKVSWLVVIDYENRCNGIDFFISFSCYNVIKFDSEITVFTPVIIIDNFNFNGFTLLPIFEFKNFI